MANTPYRANKIAKWFINRVDRNSGDVITHLKLQKLLYYAQAWHLANYEAELFDEEIQAWAHGPVVPSVWKAYKGCGWQALPATGPAPRLDADDAAFLEQVFQVYGGYGAKVLENLTHSELPWLEARGDLPPEAKCERPISRDTMRSFYAERINRQ